MDIRISEEDYRCSITGMVLYDPVATADGHVYEREAIQKWLETHNTSPKTGLPLENKNLTPVLLVKTTIQLLVEKRPELAEEVFIPRNDFYDAMKKNDGEKLRSVIETIPRLVSYQFDEVEQRTMLHHVCQKASSTKILLGALKGIENKFKQTPIEALLQTVDARTGWTPYHSSIHSSNKVIIEYLTNFFIEQGLDKVYEYWKPSMLKQTPNNLNELLLETSKSGDLNKCSLYLKFGATIETTDKSGSTPLILASFHGHKSLVELLLDNNANIEASNVSNNTPLIVAAGKGHIEVVQTLVGKKANLESTSIWGNTALIVAAFNGFKNIVEFLTNSGSDIEARNKAGNTAVMDAAMNGHKDTVDFLLEQSVDVSIKNNEGKTLFDLAKDEKLRQFIKDKLEQLKMKWIRKVPKLQQKLKQQHKVLKKQQKMLDGQQSLIEELEQQVSQLEQLLQIKISLRSVAPKQDFHPDLTSSELQCLSSDSESGSLPSSVSHTPTSGTSQTELKEIH